LKRMRSILRESDESLPVRAEPIAEAESLE
jgi:hypothetical protein